MKSAEKRLSNKQLLAASLFIVTAVVLLAAAFFEPKRSDTGNWAPLNEAVEEAISALEESEEGTVGRQANILKSTSGADDKSDRVGHSETPTQKPAQPEKEAVLEADTAGAEAIPSDAIDPEAESEANETGKLDINRATAAELDALKGIGPAKAQAIIEDRDKNGKYASVDDLLRVKGIGEKLLQAMQDGIVARP
ncbi:ComEA family DNA-binding protein [Paenibacillus sp. LPE1-1-1.1]|uniref:ComEA family DNA-binding protein n=1 Tax=Paenibacillus sp. LPE1-1-1.1 TaxID=3135230 RepID=UPI00343B62A1